MTKLLKFLLPLLFTVLTTPVLAGEVARSQFTRDVIDREPVDRVEQLDSPARQIMFFSELRDLQGQNITHQWVYHDTIMFEKTFTVGGSRWRVWSSKTLRPDWTGVWYVHILDENGTRLSTANFTYQ